MVCKTKTKIINVYLKKIYNDEQIFKTTIYLQMYKTVKKIS